MWAISLGVNQSVINFPTMLIVDIDDNIFQFLWHFEIKEENVNMVGILSGFSLLLFVEKTRQETGHVCE